MNNVTNGIRDLSLDTSISWIEKYKPKKLKEYIGNLNELVKIKDWLKHWNKNKSKSMIIFGPTGCGKTTLAYVIAKRFKYNIVEINSSDKRIAKNLQKFKLLAETNSPFAKNLILIDDVEVSQDQGFIKFMGELLKITKNPIILTCTDKYERKIATIKRNCNSIELRYPSKAELTNFLHTIIKKEKRKLNKNLINKLIDKSKCDIRFCIINLEFYSIPCKNENKQLKLAEKEKKYNIFAGSNLLFDNNVSNQEKVNIICTDRFMFENYIDHNSINTSKDLDQCLYRMDLLCDADILSHSINTKQNFNLIPHQANLLSGVTKNSKRKRIEFPNNIGKISKTNSNRIKRRKLLPKGSSFKLEEFDFIKKILYAPMITPDTKIYQQTFDKLIKIGWTIDDWKEQLFEDNSLNEQKLPKKQITKRKTKFIKFYNKMAKTLKSTLEIENKKNYIKLKKKSY